jgi:hypothetical protein
MPIVNVFLVWSGEPSKAAAQYFREWLPLIIPSATPFMSEEDIAKGTHWPQVIRDNLNACDYGVIFVSAANQCETWLNFEAGAIAKDVEAARASPVLLDLTDSDLVGPLKLFQTTKPNRGDFLRLCSSINEVSADPRALDQVEKVFDKFWPDMSACLIQVQEKLREDPDRPTEPVRPIEDVLNEILVLARGQGQTLDQLATATPPVATDEDRQLAYMSVSKILEGRLRYLRTDGPQAFVSLEPGTKVTTKQSARIHSALSAIGVVTVTYNDSGLPTWALNSPTDVHDLGVPSSSDFGDAS